MIKPSKRQLEFMEWEFGVFFHFGIRTFYEGHTDWDEEFMDAKAFNPDKLDCRQWIKTAASAGAKYAVFTAKHHDGFANWDSKFTQYSVKNTPVSGRDIVREFVDSCREYGLKPGIYYSPAQFGYKQIDNYDDYFISQISELLTNYGDIDYLWFDGCGSEGHEYDSERIIKAIRKMQPDILIFNMWDPDTRWIGNEDGYAPEYNFNEVQNLDFSVLTKKKDEMGTEKFLPAECDCRIRKNWFYQDADKDTLKTIDQLMDIYENSVGHGANLLLNLGPDRHGRIPDDEAELMAKFGECIKQKYGSPDFSSDSNVLELDCEAVIDRIVLKEDLSEGQKIKKFTVYADETPVYKGTTIGHKRICILEPVNLKKIWVDAEAGVKISAFKKENRKYD